MTTSPVSDNINDFSLSTQTKWTSVFIGVLAVMLAICAMGGDNAAKDASRANIDAANLWAFFQAKNIRRTSYNLAADDLEMRLAAEATLTAEARKAISDRVADYRAQAARMKSEPDKQEGTDELLKRAQAKEAERDAALARDPFFDWGQALLQISIVLASVSIVAASRPLLFASMGLGALGTLSMLNGFLMLVSV